MGIFSFLQPLEHDVASVAHGAASTGFNFLRGAANIVNQKVVQPAYQEAVHTAQNVAGSPSAQAVKIAAADVTGNDTARTNAFAGFHNAIHSAASTLPGVTAPLTTVDKNGKVVLNPAESAKAFNLAAAVGETVGETPKPAPGADVPKGATEKPVATIDQSAHSVAPPEPAKPIVSPEDLHTLSKATTAQQVHNALDGKLDPHLIDTISPAITQAKDPGIIDNIITKAVNPETHATPEPIPVPPTPQEVTEPVPPQPLQERGYTKSQKAGSQYSPELKAAISGKYAPAGDKPAFDNAAALVETQGLDKTHQQVLEKLQSSARINKQDIINGGVVISHLDAAGRTAEAEQLHQLLSERGTESGQASQAFGALLQRSPEGLVYKAKNDIERNGGVVTPEIQQQLDNFKENIRNTAPGSPERSDGALQLAQFVAKQVPASLQDKVFSVWRAGLLTGPQTVAKIITSHAAHGALEDVAQNIPGAAIDKFVSLFTHQRSLVASERGVLRGAKEGVGNAKDLFTTGIDKNPGTNANELHQSINFGSSVPAKVTQAYVDFVGHVHGSLYKPFYGAAHLQSLYNQAIAAAKTQGLKGAEKESFIEESVGHPSAQMLDIAKKDAETRTFQQETALGNIASAIQKKGGILGKVLVPFTKIPSAIATDLISYSPVGIMKTLVDGIKTAKSEDGWTVQAQREFSQNLGRGITGTAAIIPGIMLFNKGLMTLDYPSDPKEQKLWALEGKQPNSVLIDGQWRSLGAIGPGGSVLAIGGHLAKSLSEGNDLGSSLISGLAGGARSIEEQSYVQGISGALNALNDPNRSAKTFIKSEAGSVIPTIANTAAVATDGVTRQTNTPLDAIKGRIPGLRETLPAKVDSLGQPIQSGETGIEKLIDPFQSSTNHSSKLTDELQRLQDAGQGILPSTINNKTVFSGIKTQITAAQQEELTKAIGEQTIKRWQTIVSNPAFQSETDQQKSERLKAAYDRISTREKITFAKANKVGRYSPDYATNRKQAKANKKFVATSGG